VLRWLVAILVLGLILALTQSDSRVAYGADPTQVEEVTSELVCPCASGLTVAACQETVDCPLAAKMENLANELIADGMSKDEILDYFVEIYNESILAAPRKEGFSLSAWAVPFLGVALGVSAMSWLSWRWARQRRKDVAEAPASAGPDLTTYRKQVESDLERLR
jgi:cytochrome c-type biogenesis protein CcmH